MTVENLLKPRYKLIADYPGNMLKIGHIFELVQHEFFSEYPHLFKPLEWHEDRKPEDICEYVKTNPERTIESFVSKVISVELFDDGIGISTENRLGKFPYTHSKYFLPATKEEYQAFVNSQNSK
jgi:hypothetical protein